MEMTCSVSNRKKFFRRFLFVEMTSLSVFHILQAKTNSFLDEDIKVVWVAKNNEIKRPLSSIYDHLDSIARENSFAA